MALIVENGTGLATAEAYAAVAFVDAWLLENVQAFAKWTALGTAAQEAACRAATTWLDGQKGGVWPGTIKVSTQALHFPAVNALDVYEVLIDKDSVPVEVERAMSYAANQIAEGGALSPTTITAGQVVEKFSKVGPIETRTKWDPGYSDGGSAWMPEINNILRRIIGETTGSLTFALG